MTLLKPIVPSILDLEEGYVRDHLSEILRRGNVNSVHVDLYEDGREAGYFNTISKLTELAELVAPHDAIADIHLLSTEPLRDVLRIAALDLSIQMRVSFHVETDIDKDAFISVCKENGIFAGIALKLATDLADVELDITRFDYVHLICNDEESGLGTFQPEVLKKTRELRMRLPLHRTLLDCGIKESHILPALEAGATNLVMGSAIFKHATETPAGAADIFASLAGGIIKK